VNGHLGNDRIVSRDDFGGNDRLFSGISNDMFDAPQVEVKKKQFEGRLRL
jgi:hypothetical protein